MTQILSNDRLGSLENRDVTRQRVLDLLKTPLGTRPFNRTYGLDIQSFIDYPMNPTTIALLQSEIARATVRWVPEFSLEQVQVSTTETSVQKGDYNVTIAGSYSDNPFRLERRILTSG